ncbi:hypothetical protein [Novosphingobium sp. Fuku2-ISO-50]|uniref:hypothetical protein n=1 Tax=Novosphingobium sp. Fuku2-ISO-50 TaxID=1739114 RepID=UPI00076DBE88|nr:hypothetical protein [Novosphingobium sp. Fuku2-ISO-50]KUR79974.1 hypothetical protein AQZ50_03750 [Novosphingobium sp. Fuku2-ISO-50]
MMIAAAVAITTSATVAQTATSEALVVPPPIPATTITIPALTPVEVEVLADLSSRTTKTGQIFPIRLAQPITIDGRVVVPAGASGEGEVLDARRSGLGGASGMLMLIAHNLMIDGRALRLRSMHIGQTGEDHSKEVAVSGAVPIVGVFVMFIKGGETQVASGTRAMAKTAEDFVISPVNAAAPKPSTTEGTNQ